MIRINEDFHTKKDAARYHRTYLDEFPAIEFGTYLKYFQDRISRLWVVAGHRFA
jgi:hypothetical protein